MPVYKSRIWEVLYIFLFTFAGTALIGGLGFANYAFGYKTLGVSLSVLSATTLSAGCSWAIMAAFGLIDRMFDRI